MNDNRAARKASTQSSKRLKSRTALPKHPQAKSALGPSRWLALVSEDPPTPTPTAQLFS